MWSARARLGFKDLGLAPTSVESVLPTYLDQYRPLGYYNTRLILVNPTEGGRFACASLVFQHIACEHPGIFRDFLKADGIRLRRRRTG